MIKLLFLASAVAWMEWAEIRAQTSASPSQVNAAVTSDPKSDPALLHATGIDNLFRLSNRVYSGAAPEGDDGFASLQKLGIKTIISVDGSKPDIERAHRYGFRYVHLPHGYDGISTNVQLQLLKAAETLPGPIFVHCHHGKHRGPTAAAIICQGTEGWTSAQAVEWLKAAGTATNYTGLFQTVRRFQPPAASVLQQAQVDLPERARVGGLIEAMVAIDDQWEKLKASRKAGYQSPPDHPDLQPANEAVILWEHFREAQRLPEAKAHGQAFLEQLHSTELEVQGAAKALRDFVLLPQPASREALDHRFDAIGRACVKCHKSHRD